MGPYDNETGLYVYDKDYDTGDWYEDDAGNLIIVPDGLAEIDGPDGPVLDTLNGIYRVYGLPPTDNQLARLHLTPIPWLLHRWNREDGFYHV